MLRIKGTIQGFWAYMNPRTRDGFTRMYATHLWDFLRYGKPEHTIPWFERRFGKCQE
ncbi:MAG: hypothetical protein KGI08_04310 [Thaumarchaeota archaeon]|nr:hypothetical protein [Nitrososphaerota archaeon]